MKRAIVVHCWGGNPEYAWYPYVKSGLEAKGYKVTVPAMPDTDSPQLDKWLPALRQAIGQPDDELVLIGHSIGTVTIMRYLESLPEGARVGKVILVAAFTDPLGFQEIENFFVKPLNYIAIKSKVKNGIVLIQSDNDPYVAPEQGALLKKELDAKLIIKHGAYHMSGEVDEEDACLELPELLEEI